MNHLSVGWSPPKDATATVYNLELNGQSVYTGPRLFHVITGLAADKCYRMRILAFVRDAGASGDDPAAATSRWTPASKELRASTRARSAVSMRGLAAELAATRDEMERQALTPVQRGACAAGGFASPEYTGGGDGFAQFTGVSDEISAVGAQAAAVNCKLVICQARTRLTLPAAAPLQGRLRVAVGDVKGFHFVQRTVRIHSTAAALQFTDPRTPTQMVTIPLRGCRAFQGARPARKPGKEPSAEINPASPCWRLECTSTVTEHLFCTSNSEEARLWADRVNERTHGLRKPDRWQTAIKAAAVVEVTENKRRPRNQGVLEQAATRDAWVTTFLASLPRSGSVPHFPLFFGATQCLDLPEQMAAAARPPRSTMGIMPPRSAGMDSQDEFQAAVDEGRASDHSWLVTFADAWQSDLGALLNHFRGPALTEGFARGLLFELIFALGSARHAFGFHHNGMLDLANVRVYQVPGASPERMEQWCYVTNPGAIAMLPLIFKDEAAAGKEGTLPGTRRKDRLFELIDGADACRREKPDGAAGALLQEGAAAAAAAAGGEAAGGAGQDDASADVGASAPRYSETSSSSGGRAQARARTSWCVPSADVDGLRVVLSNFEVSSLTRVQLDWWRAGYSFPNTAWRDDLKDLAASLCGRLQALLVAPSAGLQDVCDRMASGVYAERPLMALQHPWFTSAYPKVVGVHPSRRQTFIYSPLTIADISANKAKIRAGGKGGDGAEAAPAGSGEDEAEDKLQREREAERAAALSEARRRDAQGFLAGLLGLLTPPAPWVELNDGTTLTLRWHAHKAHVRPLAPSMPSAPESFGLLQDRVSVYSGPSTTYALAAPVRGECHVFRVAAYYHALGWTAQSEPLTVGDCSAMR